MAAPRAVLKSSPGKYLRDLRQRLGMTLREVEEESSVLAAREGNQELYVSATGLYEMETGPFVPSIHRLMTLSAIYGTDFIELLSHLGLSPDRIHQYRNVVNSRRTHPISAEVHDFRTMITLPLRMDPRFRWEMTELVNHMVAVWGEIPAPLLMNFNRRRHILGLIGSDDRTMVPLIRPGSLVWIDDSRRKVVDGEFSEWERPIYFIELRDSYRCAWCQLDEGLLTLIPHPASGVRVESFNYPDDVEIVGQVAGIAMPLISSESSQEQ